jgi:hypothetical protein
VSKSFAVIYGVSLERDLLKFPMISTPLRVQVGQLWPRCLLCSHDIFIEAEWAVDVAGMQRDTRIHDLNYGERSAFVGDLNADR